MKTLPARVWLASGFLLLMLAPGIGQAACELAAFVGRHVGMGQGQVSVSGHTRPAARLYQEQWFADGTLVGQRALRIGKTLEESGYWGTVQLGPDCTALVERSFPADEVWLSQLVLDPETSGGYSLDLSPSSQMTDSLIFQSGEPCQSGTLKGVYLSQQIGLSLSRGRWLRNSVIQRERHDGAGHVQGVAPSRYGKRSETVSYTGTFDVAPNCWGLLSEIDSQGVRYHYVVQIDPLARGYWYLQTDPTDLTVAYLGRIPQP